MNLNKQKILEAGKILSQVRDYAKKIAKKGVLLVEIADKMEEKMAELRKEYSELQSKASPHQ